MARRAIRHAWRAEFDAEEGGKGSGVAYDSQDSALRQLQRFIQFADLRPSSDDNHRLHVYINRLRKSLEDAEIVCAGGPWRMAYLRLQKLVLTAIRTHNGGNPEDVYLGLNTIEFLSHQIPELAERNSQLMYGAMAAVLENHQEWLQGQPMLLGWMTAILKAPLVLAGEEGAEAYSSFACEFLTSRATTQPPFYPTFMENLTDFIDPVSLASSLATIMSRADYHAFDLMNVPMRRFNLLGVFIYLNRRAHQYDTQALASQKDFVYCISTLLLSLSSEINTYELSSEFSSSSNEDSLASNTFAKEQMMSLVNQESIQSLLRGATNSTAGVGSPRMNSEAKQLANYALTLLRFFPRRADEIRMWLYMGSTADKLDSTRLPAIKFFWQAARSSMVFSTITQDARSVIRLLKPQPAWDGDRLNGAHTEWVQDDWRVILIFLELYTFVLKLMDDEEFFSASAIGSNRTSGSSWARTNALPLDEVKSLTLFLKNLGFIMYFNSKDITDESASTTDTANLSSYFKVSSPERFELSDFPPLPKTPETALAGLSGISVDYVKGLVTGLLRMVHERDSRRKFLPEDHWLMTSLFEMDSFIPDVVAEEENRHLIERGDDELEGDYTIEEESQLVGTSRGQRLREQQQL